MASPPPHIVLFPFMSKGHTIPLLHLAHLLIHRTNAAVTVFTTPSNHPFISQSLSGLKTTIIDLPFPENIIGVPPGIESTDKLPDILSWLPLARATKLMQPHFEDALKLLPSVMFMVTDGFLWWTIDSAIKFDIPRLVYYGMGNYATAIFRSCGESGILRKIEDFDELFMVPNFPWIKLRKNEFDPAFCMEPGSKDPHLEFIIDCSISVAKSYALLVNSFYELEQVFVDFLRSHLNTKMFCAGPLCLEAAKTERPHTPPEEKKYFWTEWLDKKEEEGKSVLYVAFGSQAGISPEQFQEIKDGLEKSEVNFLWVIRKNERELKDGYEERVKDRGLIVKEWVNQREILGHKSVQGFISHCGWGSVLESICAKVPILAWPIMAEQPINARFVVEQIKIGIMVETCDGHSKGFVKSEGLRKSVVELMEGEIGKLVRKNAKEYGEAAIRAMDEGGSSWNELNKLLNELHHA